MEKRTVEGYVEHIIFRNEENGYTVLNLKMKGAELTCVGTLPAIGEGELIEASGEEIRHAVYGRGRLCAVHHFRHIESIRPKFKRLDRALLAQHHLWMLG